MPQGHNPPSVPPPVGGYVHAMALEPGARILYVSGQIPEGDGGVVPADFESQCRLVWAHIGAVLQAAGLSYANLVKVTTFLTDRRHADVNGAIRREVLGGHQPALTVVVVQTLQREWLLEIEAIAASAAPNEQS